MANRRLDRVNPHSHSHTGPLADAATRQPLSAAALAQQLDAAQAHCLRRGVQLTALRREVLELLLLRQGTAKAYDLQDDLRARHGRVAPTTVYRALEFLMEQELVHRVDATNAFVACSGGHHHHHAMLVVCSGCGEVAEWQDAAALAALGESLREHFPGFAEMGVEIKGLCARCRTRAPAACCGSPQA